MAKRERKPVNSSAKVVNEVNDLKSSKSRSKAKSSKNGVDLMKSNKSSPKPKKEKLELMEVEEVEEEEKTVRKTLKQKRKEKKENVLEEKAAEESDEEDGDNEDGEKKGKRKPKKRKRGELDDGSVLSRKQRKLNKMAEAGLISKEEAVVKEVAKKEKRTARFLGGKVLCVTSKGNEDDEGNGAEDRVEGGDEDVKYRDIMKIITDAGGSVSGILHKKIFALVATDRASLRRTQKVRKAMKYDVPIVSVQYLTACAESRSCLPRENFLIEIPVDEEEGDKVKSKKKNAPASSKKSKKSGKNTKIEAIVEPKVVELGCCCSCHDSGKPSCSWCEAHH